MPHKLRFYLDGEIVSLSDIDPTMTLLDWLRYRAQRTGTKEGCAEGDCGACTVLVGELSGERIDWRALNACILFLPMLDGKALMTVESLKGQHPVQSAMVDLHGSQCGFCTPGIVMSLVGRTMGACGTVNVDPADVLAGNLCRCTGYGPILEVSEQNPAAAFDDVHIVDALKKIRRDDMLILTHEDTLSGLTRRWFTPRSVDDLAALRLEMPEARIVAGATDVGLWVTKQHRVLDNIIYIGGLMTGIEETPQGLTIGAGVRYAEAQAALARLHPDLGELVRRIGAVQVRNAGTIGGNIANGSPIGDTPPALIALGAELTLRHGETRRTIPLEDYFLTYGQQDLQPGEFVESVFVPALDATDFVRVVKLSKRFDSDISAVCAAFHLRIAGGIVTFARLAFGGMAGTPKRAHATENVLTGKPFTPEVLSVAAEALRQDFTPLTDVRGSSDYRLEVSGNLLKRLWFEYHGESREAVHG
ncbi:xanthine dehydrogenase small subunit [Asticcacaulis sp. BYS171W]|uniref:Xanthine dehydrogenase small subunit n=1 Tax=Asticcacaulis aquaticus TaxID=2984212 RepID=A0ABT5HX73_9CAUL|nr:xanthine dehydrogenase small subunit [Asticcacaulis aquaticus]MDC7684658.1 xanthine dehydrogenase small subunit [Asticcacaulis aquaticus]